MYQVNGFLVLLFLLSLLKATHAAEVEAILPVESMVVYGVEIKFDPKNIDPESKRFLQAVLCKNRIKEVFPDSGEATKLPKEVFAIIKNETTEKAIKYDNAIIALAKKEAAKRNQNLPKGEEENKVDAMDLVLEIGEFVSDGDYAVTKKQFPSIAADEFKQAHKLHEDFVFLMLLNDQVPD